MIKKQMEAIMRRIRLNVFKGNFSLDALALCRGPSLFSSFPSLFTY